MSSGGGEAVGSEGGKNMRTRKNEKRRKFLLHFIIHGVFYNLQRRTRCSGERAIKKSARKAQRISQGGLGGGGEVIN